MHARGCATTATYGFVLAVAATIAVGIYFRSVGVFTDRFSFWHDEAVWARLVTAEDWYRHAIRPIGYLALSRLLVSLHDTELPLRMLAYVPGVFSLGLMLLVMQELGLHRALIVAALLLVASHPTLIDYSRQYKPYALSVMVHLALILTTLRCISHPCGARLALALGVCCVAPMLAIDAVFALPGALVVLYLSAARVPRHRYGLLVGLAGVLLAAAVATLYLLAWQTELRPATLAHWAGKYGVFYVPGPYVADHAVWLWQKTRALVLWAVQSHGNHALPGEARVVVTAVLAAVPLGLWHRQGLPALLLAGPIAMAFTCHLLGWWPWGPFRTNQFLIVYIVLTTGYSLDLLARSLPDRIGRAALTLVGIAVIVAHFPTDRHAFDDKRTTGDSSIKKALEIVAAHHAQHGTRARFATRVPLVVGRHAGAPVRYYTQQHAELSQRLAFMRDEYVVIPAHGWGMRMWRDPRIPSGWLWVITEHPENTRAARSYLERHCDVELLKLLPGDDLVAYARCP